MADTIITVEGHFDHHHPAERGTLHLNAGYQGPARASVLAHTTTLHRALAKQAGILEASGAVTWWSADRMRVWSERPWSQDGAQLPLVHHAAVALEVKFADLSRLAGWAEEVASEEGVTVVGIDWAITDATRVRITADAQHRAVRDAVDRATAYARSLGLDAVRPLALADPGMLGDDSRPSGSSSDQMPMMARGMAPGSANDDGLDLKPEDITVSARVHARFAAM